MPRVVVAFKTERKPYLSKVCGGIFEFSKKTEGMTYDLLYPWMRGPDWLRDFPGYDRFDAMIAGVRRESIDQISNNPMPTVTVGPEGLLLNQHWVGPDYKSVAKLAVETFVKHGFRHIVYFHIEDLFAPHSNILKKEVLELSQKMRITCSIFCHDVDYRNKPSTYKLSHQMAELAEFLNKQPKPCALFASGDHHAWRANEACKLAKLKVPQDVSIIGVRSDDYIAEFADPPLSHVFIDYHAIGYQSAKLAHDLINGKEAPKRTCLGSVAVRERASSSVTVHKDELVQACLRQMSKSLHEHITIDDIARQASVSRRTLIRRFKDVMQAPPGDILKDLRLTRAKELIMNTDLPFIEVALQCGFSDQSQLNRMVKRETGSTPGKLRESSLHKSRL